MLTRGHSLNPSLILLKEIDNQKPLICAFLRIQETQRNWIWEVIVEDDVNLILSQKVIISNLNTHIIFKKDFINPLFLYIFQSLEEISDKDWSLLTI